MFARSSSAHEALTFGAKDGNVLVGNENLILTAERRRPCECPRCLRISGTTPSTARSPSCPQERRNPENASNILGTFVNHPDLTKEFLNVQRASALQLDAATAVARTGPAGGTLTDSKYEWVQHVKMGLREGLTDDDIAGVQRGEAADPFDRTVLAAVDELLDAYELSDATWSALGERFDKRQRMDFVFTIGCYVTVSMALKTFGVELEQER